MSGASVVRAINFLTLHATRSGKSSLLQGTLQEALMGSRACLGWNLLELWLLVLILGMEKT